MKPLLAHTYEPKRWTGQNVWLQPKLNGIRALYQQGNFQSRDELPWPKGMLDHLAEPLKQMFPDERTILDGELYVHGWPLQRINQAVAINATVRGANKDTPQIEYHIFDVVSYKLTFDERFFQVMRYKHLFTPDVKIRMVDTIYTNDPSIANDFYALQVSKGYEGIMYRMGDCPYTVPKQPLNGKFLSDKNNRVWHLLKRKSWCDDEFMCIGVEEGEGKYKDMAGALMCETPDGKTFGVGSGLTDREREVYWTEANPIGRPIKVKFLCYTSDGIPFNPTILAIL